MSTITGLPPFSFQQRRDLLIQPGRHKSLNSLRPSRSSHRKSAVVLKGFVDLPLDVIHEIAEHLHPSDLLALSRLSKASRAVFTSRSAIPIWRRVLQQVPDLPSHPKDLTEMEYASLMFDKFCMACGTYRGHIKPFYGVRLRLCTRCTKLNIVDDNILWYHVPRIELRFLYMVPAVNADFPDTGKRHVFIPEAKALLNKVHDLRELRRTDRHSYSTLVDESNDKAIRMTIEGSGMNYFTKLERRRERFNKEMKKLGWDPRFYPQIEGDYMYKEWLAYIEYLGDWSTDRPFLEHIYKVNRHDKLKLELHGNLVRTFHEYREKQPFKAQCTIPGWVDIAYDSPLYDRIAARYCRNPKGSYKKELLVVVKSLISYNKFVLDNAEDALRNLVQVHLGVDDKAGLSEIFSRATTIFLYKRYMPSSPPFHLAGWSPDIMGRIIEWDTDISLEDATSYTTFPLVPTAEGILKILGQSTAATREEVEALGQFYCRCGHSDCSKPLEFCDLVLHVYEESQRSLSAEMKTYYDRRTMKTLTLCNGHQHPSTLQTLIGVIEDVTAFTDLPIIRLDDTGISTAENVERALETGWLVRSSED